MVRAARICNAGGCPVLIEEGYYCAAHRPVRAHGWSTSTRTHPADRKRIARIIRRRDHNRCRICGRYGAIIDHWLPQAWGGTDNIDNFRLMCRSCHESKTNDEKRLGKEMRKPGADRNDIIAMFLKRWAA